MLQAKTHRLNRGKAQLLRKGDDVCIMATGLMVHIALMAAGHAGKKRVFPQGVMNFHTIKPIDRDAILEMAGKVRGIVTAEEHTVIGGFGSAVAEVLCGTVRPAGFAMVGIEDKFGKSGQPDELFREYGLTPENICEKCKQVSAVTERTR